jgi:fructuronate reductase
VTVLLRRGAAPPPVRAVHLGLGSFFRSHQAWYTHRATNGDEWGIAAFTGRRPELADVLRSQDGLYTLVTRAADHDGYEVVRSLARVHAAADHDAWLESMASPDVRVLTMTVTEAGYLQNSTGELDRANSDVVHDIAVLQHDPRSLVRTVPGRIVAGLQARRLRGGGPIALVPCDNLPGNGAVVTGVVRDMAAAADPTMLDWMLTEVTAVTTVVDRITPAPTATDRDSVLAGTGLDDRCPVITEPFTEWVVSGLFPGGRPAWESAGATFVDDVSPYEQRKLWLLNGGHSLLAYTGSLRGHATVDEAMRDEFCHGLLLGWWSLCEPYLSVSTAEAATYCAALSERFANPRMAHALAQIATDGSQKLPVRLLPVLRRERSLGRLPDPVVTVLAAWILHLQGQGLPMNDVRGVELRGVAERSPDRLVRGALTVLDPAMADDTDLAAAVRARTSELSGHP